ncbi:YfzA family protein [Bacillus cytotoxicus]|uniref:YfzA family protein n=1 Tax=Bacillus cereus group sp. BfR-BA-01492 TaxID=2920361 RepID=UPI0024125183|nr:YfzA family protein [Bacillus cereus group sp. BfR-BA-01492]EMA6344084.1 hypothetical protein [Bacillus cytotoxicus]
MSQLFFIVLGVTGWIPNLGDIDGKLVGKIAESSIFRKWFTFYKNKFFCCSVVDLVLEGENYCFV